MLFFPVILGLLYSCTNKKTGDEQKDIKPGAYMLPRVLILTSGTNAGNGVMAEGVILAIQAFNKRGAFVTLQTRDILLDSAALSRYNIMIALTAAGYHDADRKYSLTFMSDEELKTIRDWVKAGGILIAGDNIGRNMMDATDRTSLYGEITPGNWALGECFGLSLVERNMKGFRIDGSINQDLSGNFVPEFRDDIWVLTVDTVVSDSLRVLANWVGGQVRIPAMIQNHYGKGLGILLPSSYMLHPANSGGYWGAEEIDGFYKYILEQFNRLNHCSVSFNIWPGAHDYAFCATINAAGNPDEYKREFSLFKDEKVEPSVFVSSKLDSAAHDMLKDYAIQSNGFVKLDYQAAQFYEIKRNIIQNELYWNRKFSGFRFPFTRSSYWGFECLSTSGYSFDSSIGLDNLENFYGSAFPYNIIISANGLYKNTDMIEISPVLHDDYYFYENLLTDNYPDNDISRDARLYQKYLMNFWELVVKPSNGLMVWLGHPLYSGHNDSTLFPVKQLIEKVKSENTWITTIESVAEYWKSLAKMQLLVNENESSADVFVAFPDSTLIREVSVKTLRPVKSAESKNGACKIVKKDSLNYVLFDAYNKQHVTIRYSK